MWALGEASPFVLHLWAPGSLFGKRPPAWTHREAAERRTRPRKPGDHVCDPGPHCLPAGSLEPLSSAGRGKQQGSVAAQSQSHPPMGCLSLRASAGAAQQHPHPPRSSVLCPPHTRPAPWARLLPTERRLCSHEAHLWQAVLNGPESHLSWSCQRPGLPGRQARAPAHLRRPAGLEGWARRTWGSRLNKLLTWARGVAELPETVAGGPRDS